MKKQTWLILTAVVLLSLLPLWLVPHFAPPANPEAPREQIFAGADSKAQQAIGEIAPNYQPWFAPLLEPASDEIASLLFALQAALGAGALGYWLGCAVTRDRLRREAAERAAEDQHDKAPRAD